MGGLHEVYFVNCKYTNQIMYNFTGCTSCIVETFCCCNTTDNLLVISAHNKPFSVCPSNLFIISAKKGLGKVNMEA